MALLSPSVAFNSSPGVPRAHAAAGNPTNPIVFFDINLGGSNAGRIVMEVSAAFSTHITPRTRSLPLLRSVDQTPCSGCVVLFGSCSRMWFQKLRRISGSFAPASSGQLAPQPPQQRSSSSVL